MRELTDPELYQALKYARDLDDAVAGKIIERFQIDQTALAQTLFNVFPMIIADQNHDMSYFFMSLCFDVIYVSQEVFGPLPLQNEMGFVAGKTGRASGRRVSIVDD